MQKNFIKLNNEKKTLFLLPKGGASMILIILGAVVGFMVGAGVVVCIINVSDIELEDI